jgi:hypothetical protein
MQRCAATLIGCHSHRPRRRRRWRLLGSDVQRPLHTT